MLIGLGFATVALSIALIRAAKKFERQGSRFWTYATGSLWLPLVFTTGFGLGFVMVFLGILSQLGS